MDVTIDIGDCMAVLVILFILVLLLFNNYNVEDVLAYCEHEDSDCQTWT